MADTIAAQRQFLVSVEGIGEFMAQKGGGDVSAGVTKVYDGGSLTPDVLAAPAETSDLTVGRGYKPSRDNDVIRRLRPQVSRWRTTITVQDTDADLIPVGRPTVYPQALLVGVSSPDHDAGSGDAARFELTFAVSSAANQ